MHLAVFISISEIQTVQTITELKCLSVCYFPRPITRSYFAEISISGSLLWLKVMGEMALLRGLAASDACKCPEALRLSNSPRPKKRDVCAATTLALQTVQVVRFVFCLWAPRWLDLDDIGKTRQQRSRTLITASRGVVLTCVHTHVEPLSH